MEHQEDGHPTQTSQSFTPPNPLFTPHKQKYLENGQNIIEVLHPFAFPIAFPRDKILAFLNAIGLKKTEHANFVYL